MNAYRRSLIGSLFFHVILVLLALGLRFSNPETVVPPASHAPVQAITVNDVEVAKAVKQIQQERLSERFAEQKKLAAVKKELQVASKKRAQEKQKLTKLHKQAMLKEQSLRDEDRKLKRAQQTAQRELKKLADQKKQAIAEQAQLKRQITNLKTKTETPPKKAPTPVEKTPQQVSTINRYKALIVQAIAEYWVVPQDIDGQSMCVVRARLAPDGSVLEVVIVKNSGNDALDRSAVAAVYKASPLPIPKDTNLFDTFRELQLTVRPEGIVKV